MIVSIAVEGVTDTAVARRLLAHVGLEPGPVYEQGGKAGLDRKVQGYNRAAAKAPWFVLRDLDQDGPCAGAVVGRLLPDRARTMCFRLAVREVEAWLLADRTMIARYLSVAVAVVPLAPELLPHPKRELVNLARKSARRTIRDDFVPPAGSTAQVGPGYTQCIVDFAGGHWRPNVAALASPSLARCLAALQLLAAQGR